MPGFIFTFSHFSPAAAPLLDIGRWGYPLSLFGSHYWHLIGSHISIEQITILTYPIVAGLFSHFFVRIIRLIRITCILRLIYIYVFLA